MLFFCFGFTMNLSPDYSTPIVVTNDESAINFNDSFVYLGCTVGVKDSDELHIQRRLAMAYGKVSQMKAVLCCRLSIRLRACVLASIIFPSLLISQTFYLLRHMRQRHSESTERALKNSMIFYKAPFTHRR
jgi:hypothetical protein